MFERKKLRPVILVLAAALCVFQLLTSLGVLLLNPLVVRSVHVGLILPLIFLWRSPNRALRKNPRPEALPVLLWDLLLVAISAAACAYIAWNEPMLAERMPQIDEVTPLQIILGAGLVFCILEATRRLSGWALVIVALAALAYAFFGHGLPGNFGHLYLEADRIIESLYLLNDGIWGSSIGASSSIIFLFILFGAILDKTNMASVFLELACLITRRAKGGPAKAAIFGSALFGSVSGSAAANVYATGTFTIPLMKRVGYTAPFAGAVEAVASTGGQIMPPIMGAAAFIMADLTGAGYLAVAKAALLPALLYYLALLAMIHFEALSKNLGKLPADQVPDSRRVLSRLYYLLPIVLLLVAMFMGRSVIFCAFFATLCVVLLSFFRRETRMTPSRLLQGLEWSARNALMISSCCACAGIVIGVIALTGVGYNFINLVTTLAGDSLFLLMLFLTFTCIVLGMGVPTTPAYIIVATLGAPALIKMGVPAIAAHMFVFYYAILSVITPPVCMASFAGAAIAEADAMKTGFVSVKLGIVAFIIPFMFVYQPALLLQGNTPDVAVACVTAVIGVIGLAMGMQGWMLTNCAPWERVLLIVGGLTLIYPGSMTDALGIALIVLAGISQAAKRKAQRSEV